MALTDVNEQSAKIVTVAVTSDTGGAVTPNSVNYSLLDGAGNVVNNRNSSSISPSSSMTIVLGANDHKRDIDNYRYLLVRGLVNLNSGDSQPFVYQESYKVLDVLGVS